MRADRQTDTLIAILREVIIIMLYSDVRCLKCTVNFRRNAVSKWSLVNSNFQVNGQLVAVMTGIVRRPRPGPAHVIAPLSFSLHPSLSLQHRVINGVSRDHDDDVTRHAE